jgi:hypothetical protein
MRKGKLHNQVTTQTVYLLASLNAQKLTSFHDSSSSAT